MRVHTTRDGTKIKLCDMADSHLAATIALMERRATEGIVVRFGGGSCAEDMWYDEDHFEGEEALKFMGYYDYVAEQEKRGNRKRGRG